MLDGLLAAADLAMYQAKRAGGHQAFITADPGLALPPAGLVPAPRRPAERTRDRHPAPALTVPDPAATTAAKGRGVHSAQVRS